MTIALKHGRSSLAERRATGRLGLMPACALAIVATGALSIQPAATVRIEAPSAAEVRPAVASGRPASTSPRPVARAETPPDQANVEALVQVTSRKYRISHDAMRELVDTAYREATRNRIDPLLVIAVMAVESRFNPIAQSNHGATGLMQVIPRYHSDKFSAAAGESVLDPHTNIRVGVRVLKDYVVRGGNEAAGLQLYNGASRDPTRAYATRVLAERSRLRGALRPGHGRPPAVNGVLS